MIATRTLRISWLILSAAGTAVIGIGFYFIILRPPLLPEDLRFMALPASQLEIVMPALTRWLAHVFTVLGGYAVATGVLTIALAATSFRGHNRAAAFGAALGGASSVGLMAAINILIDSDFKWILLSIALLWLSSLLLFWFETKTDRSLLRRRR